MLALTVLQPYASALIAGVKPVENRTWRPPDHAIGQRIFIHAGRGGRMLSPENIAEVRALWPGAPLDPADYPRGVVLGSVLLTGVQTYAERLRCPWSCGPVCWVVKEPRAIEPVTVKGRLGLWELSPEAISPAASLKPEAAARR